MVSRFTDLPRPQGGIPESVALYPDWHILTVERARFDRAIIDWADGVNQSWLAADQTYFSAGARREVTKPRWILVTHMFNHQTHHRGQVHCMLTQAGRNPHDTDLPLTPQ